MGCESDGVISLTFDDLERSGLDPFEVTKLPKMSPVNYIQP